MNKLVDKGSSRKGKYEEYRKILSGKIEYQPPSKDSNKFSGYVKLKKDPKAEPLTEENFMPRGSILKNTDWFETFVKLLMVLGCMVFAFIQETILELCSVQNHLLTKIAILKSSPRSSLL